MKRTLLLLFLLTPSIIFSMESSLDDRPFKETIYYYYDLEITPEVIQYEAPSLSSDHPVCQWITNNAKTFAYAAQTNPSLQAYKTTDHSINTQIVKELDCFPKSNNNHIFKVPSDLETSDNESYYFQISSQASRIQNIAARYGIENPQWNDWDTLQPEPTYQTISRIATYMRWEAVQDYYQIEYIEIPTTYLQHIPGRPEECTDENYIIIQQKLPSIEKDSVNIDAIDNRAFGELFYIIKFCGLWDLVRFDGENSNMVTTKNNKLGITDLEQHPQTQPEDFFNKNFDQYCELMFLSFASVINFLQKQKKNGMETADKKLELFVQEISDDKTLKTLQNSPAKQTLETKIQKLM